MDKIPRPARNRRNSRKPWPPGDSCRTVKRLFTPEIKRMLKDWLVRRRENPYPSRDEKRKLAYDTGLTYTQICNWFANWRRKLKNTEGKTLKNTWGHLIKNYNTKTRGNVEQFSICSSDSIWEEEECNRRLHSQISHSPSSYSSDSFYDDENHNGDRELSSDASLTKDINQNQVYIPGFYVESGTNLERLSTLLDSKHQHFQIYTTKEQSSSPTPSSSNNPKYKQKMMEKYLRDTSSSASPDSSPELSKWLESAAKFTPEKSSYYIDWNNQRQIKKTSNSCKNDNIYESIHQKEELDAAEALANLAFNSRQRMLIQSGSRFC